MHADSYPELCTRLTCCCVAAAAVAVVDVAVDFARLVDVVVGLVDSFTLQFSPLLPPALADDKAATKNMGAAADTPLMSHCCDAALGGVNIVDIVGDDDTITWLTSSASRNALSEACTMGDMMPRHIILLLLLLLLVVWALAECTPADDEDGGNDDPPRHGITGEAARSCTSEMRSAPFPFHVVIFACTGSVSSRSSCRVGIGSGRGRERKTNLHSCVDWLVCV